MSDKEVEEEEEEEKKDDNLNSPLIKNKNNNEIQNEDEKIYEEEKINVKEKKDEPKTVDDSVIERIKTFSYVINRKVRWTIFLLFTIINLLMNFDHGTVPAATQQLRIYLELTDSELGLFGSLVFLGVIIGSLVSLTIINTFNRKYILMICLILCSLALFAFTKTTQYPLLCLDRVIIGIFQAFISIYLPVWCEQFGVEKRKALMMALIQVAPPLGVLVGYIITTLLNMFLTWLPIVEDIGINERWLYSFYIQSFVILIISLILLFFSDKYFNSKARRVPHEVEENLNDIEKEKTGDASMKKISFFYDGNQSKVENKNNDVKNENEGKEGEEKKENEEEEEKEDDSNKEKKIEIKKEEENNKDPNTKKKKKGISFCEKLKHIFSEPLFIFPTLTLSLLFFIVTCVQYWTSDYMLVALHIEEETKRLYSFSFVCLTSPTLGLVLGGYIVDKLGGYAHKRALIFCLIAAFLSVVPSIPLPLVDNLYLYAGLLWIMLFLGASTIPTMQGIILSCLPKDVQGSGNSFSIFFYNLLGYLPAPFVYGFFKDRFDDKDEPTYGSRMAQRITMWSTSLVLLSVGISTIIRFMKSDYYDKKMGREQAKAKENKEKENMNDETDDEDAIRPRESSLAFNKQEHERLADKIAKEDEKNNKEENLDNKNEDGNSNGKTKDDEKNDNDI